MTKLTAKRRDHDATFNTDPGREIVPAQTSRRVATIDRNPNRNGNDTTYGSQLNPSPVYQDYARGFQPMPDYARDLIDHRPGGQRTLRPFKYLSDIHAWPAIGIGGFAAFGVGVHGEPLHPWIAGGMIGFGIVSLGFAGAAHLVETVNDGESDRIMSRGAALLGLDLVAGGSACASGASWITGMLAFAAAGVSYVGWHLFRHFKLERQRDFVVNMTEVSNPAGAPLPPVAAPMPVPLPQIVSWEASRLHDAFEAIKVSPIQIRSIDQAGQDAHTARIGLPKGSNISPTWVMTRRLQLGNNMGCRHVEITRGEALDEIVVTWFDGDDKLADTVLWPGPSITSFEQPIALGLFENLEVVEQNFLWLHALVAGATDNGKSGIINVILCSSLPCTDVVRIGIDCKAGAPELGPYKRAMYKLATNPTDGMRVLNGIKAVITARGEFIGIDGESSVDDDEDAIPVRKWDPKYGPYLLVPIDELAELTREYPEAGKILESIRQLGRYVGVHCLDATQYPSKGVFGGKTDPRQQYQVRIGMSCPETASINVIFGSGAQGAGWRLEELPHKGSFMIKSRQHKQPRVARAYYVTDEMIAAMVKRWADECPDLDTLSADAFEAAYALEPIGGDNPDGPDGGHRTDAIEAGPSGRPLQLVKRIPTRPDMWRHFNGRVCWTVDELVDLKLADLKSRDSVRKLLRDWMTNGFAWKADDGKYYPIPDTDRREA